MNPRIAGISAEVLEGVDALGIQEAIDQSGFWLSPAVIDPDTSTSTLYGDHHGSTCGRRHHHARSLGWEGIHVFHYPLSSCSQKLRIFLNLKGAEWQSHVVDLQNKENLSARYLGINPRGLVPTLVHDGAVHIESNDILVYLEHILPEPRLIPVDMEDQMTKLLSHEDDLHLDLRTLSFKFMFAPPGPPKSEEDLKRHAATGSGTVQGRTDTAKDEQIAFWQRFIMGDGISDDIARRSVQTFRTEFTVVRSEDDNPGFAVGTPISGRPPHVSEHARFRHSAPTLGV